MGVSKDGDGSWHTRWEGWADATMSMSMQVQDETDLVPLHLFTVTRISGAITSVEHACEALCSYAPETLHRLLLVCMGLHKSTKSNCEGCPLMARYSTNLNRCFW